MAVRWIAGHVAQSAMTPIAPPQQRLTELILHSRAFAAAPDSKPAVVEALSGMQRTFGDLRKHVPAAKHAMKRDFGVVKGVTATLVSPNHADYFTAVQSVVGLGGVISPLNPAYQRAEISHQLKASQARLVIAHPACLKQVMEACKDAPSVRHIIALDGDDDDYLIPAGMARFSSLVGGPQRDDAPTPCAGGDLAMLPFSSGTTGLPKGVRLSHDNLTYNLLQIVEPFGALGSADALMSPLPFFHIYGFTVSLHYFLFQGSTVVTMKKYETAKFCDMVQRFRVTHAHIVPPIVIQLAKEAVVDQFDLSSLKDALSAAAPLGESTAADCAKRFPGLRLRQAWGMTELSPIATMTPPGAHRPGSVGPPVANTAIKVVDVRTREPLPVGSEGELCVQGPQVMLGYDRAEDTSKCLAADGWLATGDIAYIEQDGFVTVTDRIKELIKVSGFQVSASELEALLMTHPNVLDAAVIPRPHERFGEVPRAYVVLREATAGVEDALVEWAAPQLVHYKKLRGGVVVTDRLPKTSSGKLLRREVLKADRERFPAAGQS